MGFFHESTLIMPSTPLPVQGSCKPWYAARLKVLPKTDWGMEEWVLGTTIGNFKGLPSGFIPPFPTKNQREERVTFRIQGLAHGAWG